MERFLVAYEAPTSGLVEDEEASWNTFVDSLRAHRLQLVNDLDPIDGNAKFTIYEVVSL